MRDLNRDLSETITLRMGRGKLLLLFIGSLALAAMSYSTWSSRPADSLPHLIAAVGAWFFGSGVVLAPILMIWPMASVRLSPQGLEYRIFVMKLGPIPWSAIRNVAVRDRGGSQVVLLDVPDRQRYGRNPAAADLLAQSPHFQAILHRPLSILASMLGVSGEQLAAAIQARIEKFGSNTISSQQGTP